MTLIYHIIRTLLGLILICATAITFGFLPMPDQSLFSTEGYALIQAIIDTGYLWQTIGVACAFVGIFYVINRFVTLATMVLIPISINVVLFQIH